MNGEPPSLGKEREKSPVFLLSFYFFTLVVLFQEKKV